MRRPTPTPAPFTTRVRVRYAETDAAGVVYYGNYLTYFEVARVEWLRALGCPVTEVERRGILLPVVEVRVRYLLPARLDDLLTVDVWLVHPRRASFGFEYEVRRGDELVASGATRHAVVDRRSGRAVPLPGWMRELLEHATGAPVNVG